MVTITASLPLRVLMGFRKSDNSECHGDLSSASCKGIWKVYSLHSVIQQTQNGDKKGKDFEVNANIDAI